MPEYTLADLEALKPEWREVFDEEMPFGFEIGPETVPLMRRCIREQSKAPLVAYQREVADREY